MSDAEMDANRNPDPLHVLVVDDDPGARAKVRDILELNDYHIEEAGTAREALDRRDWSRYGAILLDLRLPDGTAEELLPQLRYLAPQAKALVVTDYADVQGAIAALRLGAVDYILKPINADELCARLGQIAARVRAEQQIHVLSTIPAESPHPVLRIGRDGVLGYANAASTPLLALWGCSVGQRVPDSWQWLVRDVFDSGANREVEVECGGRTYSLLLTPIPGADCVNIYGSDISDYKRAEETLRHERELAESLSQTAQAIVLVLDPEGRSVRWNSYLEELSGYRPDEVRGQDWCNTLLAVEDAPRMREAFRRTLVGAATHNLSSRMVTKSRSEREILWSHTALRDARGAVVGVLAVGYNITALRDAQRRALQAERLAAIGQRVTILAHESVNALARSQACLEMLTWEVGDLPKAQDLLRRMQAANDQLQHLHEAVRGYAAPIQLERATCDLATIWRQTWEHLAVARQGRDAVLREEAGGIDLHCCVDAFGIECVFRNVLENALAACRDPVRIAIVAQEATLGTRPAVRVCVRDNGPGLNEEQRLRIFEPFYTTRPRGTGLGMAIARRIVETHGGQIGADLAPGGGAEITITLPREGP